MAKTTGHVDAGEALKFGSGNVFEQPGGEIGREDMEIFTIFGSERLQGAVFAGEEIEGTVGFFAAEETVFLGERSGKR